MPSFLSAKQIEMLRDDLARLQRPNDADQIQVLRDMCNAFDDNDAVSFKAGWTRLKVGYGARLSVGDEQFDEQHGGSAQPPLPEELNEDAKNVLRDLNDRLYSPSTPTDENETTSSAPRGNDG